MTADTPVHSALQQLLLNQWRILEIHEPRILDPADHEALHDYRVAIRRTRSLLGQFKDLWPDKPLRQHRKNFARLGELTGRARDLDVCLERMSDYQAIVALDDRFSLAATHKQLMKLRRQEQKKIVRGLGAPGYLKFKTRWQEWLEALPATLAGEEPPIGSLAEERISAQLDAVLEQGRANHEELAPEALHELRKGCKKLRYLLEFFAPLRPKAQTSRLVKTLKSLQDCLGAHQDLTIQIELMYQAALTLNAKSPDPGNLLATGLLIGELHNRRRRLLAGFPKVFASFVSQANSGRQLQTPTPAAEDIDGH